VHGIIHLPDSGADLLEFLHKCPHHGMPKSQLVEIFYDGLHPNHRQLLDGACGGMFFNRSEEEAYQIIETLSENSMQHAYSSNYDRSTTRLKMGGSGDSQLINRVQQLEQQLEGWIKLGNTSQAADDDGGKKEEIKMEEVQAAFGLGQQPYNPNKFHPNLSYGNPNNALNSHMLNQNRFRPPANTFSPNNNQPSSSASLNTLQQMMQQMMQQFQALQQQTQRQLQHMEQKLQQLANPQMLRRDAGQLPSQPIQNPRPK